MELELRTKIEAITEDVASLTRVRNRLAASPDTQLPRILTALVPKLMLRLEQYHEASFEYAEYQEIRLKALENVSGILGHGLERVRGNLGIKVTEIINTLLRFTTSKSPVASTWALAFLRFGIQRCTADTLPTSTMASLVHCVDASHRELLFQGKTSTRKRLDNASWLLLDCIVMHAGLTPLIDWDLDSYESQGLRWETKNSDSWDSITPDGASLAVLEDGAGVLDLLLDLLLFWPTEAAARCGISEDGDLRMTHRSRISEEEIPVQAQRMRPQGANGRTRWNETTLLYLRHLKLNALRCAIWPAGKALFQGKHMDTALLLSILTAAHNSNHGRLAADFLNEYNSSISLKKKKGASFKISSATCSLALASSLLILMVGDQISQPLLRTFVEKHKRTPWESILGSRPLRESMQRPPLPFPVAARALQFLLDHPIVWPNTEKETKDDVRLLIDLSLLLGNQQGHWSFLSADEQRKGKFWAVQLVESLYKQLLHSSIIDLQDADDWASHVFEKCIDASVEVLTVVVELGDSNVEKLRQPHNQTPLGVPGPFHRRNDLNRLLDEHRTNQKKRKLGMEEAALARQVAYALITKLAAFSFGRENRPFELPIFLIKCAVYEDEFMEHYVTEALDALLNEYTIALDTNKKFQVGHNQSSAGSSRELEAVSLLPSLLDAVCSDAVPARVAAINWIRKLLRRLDPQAAYFLASYMVGDEDASVSSAARDVIKHEKNSILDASTRKKLAIFIDIETDAGLSYAETKLKSRITELSERLEVPLESAAILLCDHLFSVEDSQTAFENNAKAVQVKSGLISELKENDTQPSLSEFSHNQVCGICYDDTENSETFSMECGHVFCRDCWVSFLETSATAGSPMSFLNVRCPQHDCSARILSHHLQAIGSQFYKKRSQAFVEAFIEFDQCFRRCTGPDCKFIGVIPTLGQRSLVTTCEHCETSFCFHCGDTPHQPARCEDVAQWNKLKESSNFWIRRNAKPCPGCKAPIEKNQGCNHMICERCETQFCWLCLTKLQAHSEDHVCNRYDPSSNAEDDLERRALFNADRYQAHDQAEQFALDQRKSLLEKPEKLTEMFWFLTTDDEAILQAALGTVIDARRFLKNSYIASFGSRSDSTKLAVLESQQAALEIFTERLSQLTETNLQRLYTEKGEKRLQAHFRGLDFYRVSVMKYIDRFLANVLPENSV